MSNSHRSRHLTFLQANVELLARESPAAWRRDGRGFWFAAEWLQAAPPGQTQLQYHDRGGLDVLTGSVRRDVERMIDRYDPTWQAVVVISEEDDSIHGYTVGFGDAESN